MKNYLLPITTLLIAVFIFQFTSQAQHKKAEATIQLQDGKELNGHIMYGDWITTPNTIEYFPSDGTHSKMIDIETIKRVDVKSYNKYVSRMVTYDNNRNQLEDLKMNENIYDTVKVFRLLRIVFEGKLNLYEYTNKNGRQYFFIENNEGEFVTLENKKYIENTYLKEVTKYKNQLSYFMHDCHSVEHKIAQLHYEEAALRNLFSDYFNCSNSKATYESRKQVSLQMYAFGGLNYTQLKFKGTHPILTKADFGYGLNYNAMLAFLFTSFQKFDKHQVAIEFILKNYAFKSSLDYYNQSLTGGGLEKFKFDFGFTYLRGNAGYRFSFIKKAGYRVYTDLGYNIGFLIRQNTSFSKNGSSHSDYFDAISFDSGYSLGIGSIIHKLSLLARFERAGGVSPFIGTKSPLLSLNLFAGYRIF